MTGKLAKNVYFLRRKDGVGPIKIGCSAKPVNRLYLFGLWSPYPLALLASAPGGHDMERALHLRFCAYRLHSEWFAPNPQLLALIDLIAVGATLTNAMAATAAPPELPDQSRRVA